MAGIRISNLPSGGQLQNNDVIPIARSGLTYSIKGDVIFPITEEKIGNESVSNRTLSSYNISLDKLRTISSYTVLGNDTHVQGAVQSVKVSTEMIAGSAITSEKIANEQIKDINIETNTIDYKKLKKSINGNIVLGSTVSNGDIVETQILGDMIANNAITSDKIAVGGVNESNIQSEAVTRNNIKNNEVTFSKLQQVGFITNSVVGYINANTDAQVVKINSNMISEGFGLVPQFGIIMYSGSIFSIPTGWALCDGTNGTPDLRERFIVGAGTSNNTSVVGTTAYNIGDSGGLNSVTLDLSQLPAHGHPYSDYYINTAVVRPTGNVGFELNPFTGGGVTNVTETGANLSRNTNNAGGGLSHENRPPFYALAFIMKL